MRPLTIIKVDPFFRDPKLQILFRGDGGDCFGVSGCICGKHETIVRFVACSDWDKFRTN
jgi:hypothetical protein